MDFLWYWTAAYIFMGITIIVWYLNYFFYVAGHEFQ